MKYDDVRFMRNPLRERSGPSITEAFTITQMQKYMRYPVPEYLIHVPEKYTIFIDSLITQAYHMDEIMKNASYRQEISAPYPST